MVSNNPQTGACHCGAIKFETILSPSLVEYCHCNTCRRLNGSAVSTLAGFPRSNFTLTQGTPVNYESSPGVFRSFCGKCGTRLFWESGDHDHEIYICLGAFDSPAAFPAQCHVWTSDRLPWVDMSDDLPKHPEFMKNSTEC